MNCTEPNWDIRIRHGLRDVTFADAVRLLELQADRFAQAALQVTATYRERESYMDGRGQKKWHERGEAVFGVHADVYGIGTAFGGEMEPAIVQIGGLSAHSPDIARVRIACYQLAVQLADAANASLPGNGVTPEWEAEFAATEAEVQRGSGS